MEYTDENGQLQISQGIRFRVMGQYSLDMPQKSLYIKADGQFGKSEFDYALFDDRRSRPTRASFCATAVRTACTPACWTVWKRA